MTLAKYTWKNYGVSLSDLKHRTLPKQFLDYEEMMYISADYEFANYKDTQPKNMIR